MLNSFLVGFKSLFYPPSCLLCQEPLCEAQLKQFCPSCFDQFVFIDPEGRCPRCFSFDCPLDGDCQRRTKFCRRVVACFDYEGNAEALIGALKFGGRSYLAEGLGALMTLQWLNRGHSLPDIIVPVPSSPLTTFKRGYSPSNLLAESVGKIMNRPVWKGLSKELSFIKQAHLSENERKCLAPDQILFQKDFSSLRDKHVLLVDDVLTTGQTVHISASRLLEAYPRVIDALVFAR